MTPFALDETREAVFAMADALGRDLGAASLTRDERGAPSEDDLRALRDAELLSLLASEEAGGAGFGEVELRLALEALAAHAPSLAMVVWAHNMAHAWATEAEREGDSARWIADAVGLAVPWGEGRHIGAVSGFALVPDERGGPATRDVGDPTAGLGFRGASWTRSPEAAATLPATVAPIACRGLLAISAGICRGAHRAGLAYAKERKQFKRPIADFQAIQWMLADGATTADALSLLSRASLGAGVDGAHSRLRYAAHRCQSVADTAVQIHGGAGYTTEYPAERFLRDATTLMRFTTAA